MEVVGAANIDVLFVNAGISRFKPISMMDEAFFDTLFGINVGDAYFVMKHAIEIMPDGGSITKAAVRSFGRTFARELARQHNQSRPPGLAKAGMQPRTNGEHSSADRTARESGPSRRSAAARRRRFK